MESMAVQPPFPPRRQTRLVSRLVPSLPSGASLNDMDPHGGVPKVGIPEWLDGL